MSPGDLVHFDRALALLANPARRVSVRIIGCRAIVGCVVLALKLDNEAPRYVLHLTTPAETSPRRCVSQGSGATRRPVTGTAEPAPIRPAPRHPLPRRRPYSLAQKESKKSLTFRYAKVFFGMWRSAIRRRSGP